METIIEDLKTRLRELVQIMDVLIARFPRRLDRPRLPILAIYLTIYDLADSIVSLYSNDMAAAIPTLLRSAIDSLFDLKLLNQSLDNINFLMAKALTESIKRSQTQLDPRIDNPSLLNNPERRDAIRKQLRQNQQQLKDLQDRGYRPLSQADKFERLGDKHFHSLVFSVLNKEAHNSIDVLILRHIEILSDSQIRFKYKQTMDGAKASQIYFDVSTTLLDATSLARKMMDIEFKDELERMVKIVAERAGAEIAKANWYDYE